MPCSTYFEIVNLLSEAHSLARMPLTNRFPTIKTFSCTILHAAKIQILKSFAISKGLDLIGDLHPPITAMGFSALDKR